MVIRRFWRRQNLMISSHTPPCSATFQDKGVVVRDIDNIYFLDCVIHTILINTTHSSVENCNDKSVKSRAFSLQSA